MTQEPGTSRYVEATVSGEEAVGRVPQQVQQLGAPPALVADGGALTSAGCGVGLSGGG
eukprot:COSAG03_NODE_16061_length_412_cov_12.843450_2_plen_57_part_01